MRRFERGRQRRDVDRGRFHRRAHRPGDGDAGRHVFPIVDARDHQIGLLRHDLKDAVQHSLGRSPAHGVDGPVLTVHGDRLGADNPVRGERQAAPGAGGLLTRRGHGDVSQRRQRFRGCPQSGGLDSIVIRKKDLYFGHGH